MYTYRHKILHSLPGPGKIALFDLQYESDTSILVPWSRPVRPGGPVNYYQLVGAHYKGPTRLPTTYTRRFTPRDIFAAELMENPDRFFFTTNCKQNTDTILIRVINSYFFSPTPPLTPFGSSSVPPLQSPKLSSAISPCPAVKNTPTTGTRTRRFMCPYEPSTRIHLIPTRNRFMDRGPTPV